MTRRARSFEYRIELFTNEAALNKLGREGWELVCPGGKDGNYLVFKRAVDDAAPGTGTPEPSKAAAKKKSYKDFL